MANIYPADSTKPAAITSETRWWVAKSGNTPYLIFKHQVDAEAYVRSQGPYASRYCIIQVHPVLDEPEQESFWIILKHGEPIVSRPTKDEDEIRSRVATWNLGYADNPFEIVEVVVKQTEGKT